MGLNSYQAPKHCTVVDYTPRLDLKTLSYQDVDHFFFCHINRKVNCVNTVFIYKECTLAHIWPTQQLAGWCWMMLHSVEAKAEPCSTFCRMTLHFLPEPSASAVPFRWMSFFTQCCCLCEHSLRHSGALSQMMNENAKTLTVAIPTCMMFSRYNVYHAIHLSLVCYSFSFADIWSWTKLLDKQNFLTWWWPEVKS